MLIFDYPSKKELKTQIGQPLNFAETSIFGAEYRESGQLVGCNRPHLTGHKREFFAQVTMFEGLITRVS